METNNRVKFGGNKVCVGGSTLDQGIREGLCDDVTLKFNCRFNEFRVCSFRACSDDILLTLPPKSEKASKCQV